MSTTYFASPFELPTERFVGILSCQNTPFLKEMETTVISCEEATAETPKTNQAKKAQKAVKQPTTQYAIRLNDSVLFPEGGGQPWDTGRLIDVANPVNTANVNKVVRKGVQAVHYSDKAFPLGTRVKVVLDWDRRLDLMSQHTGQHLLSSVLEHMHQIPTVGWSLTPSPQACYVELPRVPTDEEIQNTINTCNQLIRDNIPLKVDICLEGDNPRPASVPADYRDGVIRHVTITSPLLPNDRNACCGTHAESLGFLQALYVLPKTTSIRGTNTRLYFMVGARVLENLASNLQIASNSALALGCGLEDLPARVGGAIANLKDSTRREKKLREELAQRIARDMVSEAAGGDSRSTFCLREEEEPELLTAIVAQLREIGAEGSVYCLASSNSPTSSIMIVGNSDRVNATAAKLKEGLGGRLKGGGKGSWQGKLEGRIKKSDAELIRTSLA